MLDVAARFPDFQAVVAGAPGLTADDYRSCLGERTTPKIIYGQTYHLLSHASAALVTSGTATLEAALFRVPQVVCYHVSGGRLVNFVFDRFFHVPYISLVNLIAGREVVSELFGAKFSAERIHHELKRIVEDPPYRAGMQKGYDRVIAALGQPGASQHAARLIVESLKKRT